MTKVKESYISLRGHTRSHEVQGSVKYCEADQKVGDEMFCQAVRRDESAEDLLKGRIDGGQRVRREDVAQAGKLQRSRGNRRRCKGLE